MGKAVDIQKETMLIIGASGLHQVPCCFYVTSGVGTTKIYFQPFDEILLLRSLSVPSLHFCIQLFCRRWARQWSNNVTASLRPRLLLLALLFLVLHGVAHAMPSRSIITSQSTIEEVHLLRRLVSDRGSSGSQDSSSSDLLLNSSTSDASNESTSTISFIVNVAVAVAVAIVASRGRGSASLVFAVDERRGFLVVVAFVVA